MSMWQRGRVGEWVVSWKCEDQTVGAVSMSMWHRGRVGEWVVHGWSVGSVRTRKWGQFVKQYIAQSESLRVGG
jgi:hypothetical protein